MIAKRLLVVLTAVSIALCSTIVCYAENSVVFVQAHKGEQNIGTYIVGDITPHPHRRKVSNRATGVSASDLLVCGDIPVTAALGSGLDDKPGGYRIGMLIGTGVGLIVIVAVTIVLVVIRRKKKLNQENHMSPDTRSAITKESEITESPHAESYENKPGIRLCNINNPDQLWSLSLSNTVVIGRDPNCQVCIHDGSMSRQQCKIYLVNNIPVVENVSSTNVTRLNDEKLLSYRTIKEGDRINCGRVTLLVDLLYGPGLETLGNLSEMTVYVNV